jgi:hypothetical protein
VAAVADKGTTVVVLEPGADNMALMQAPGPEYDRAPGVAESAYQSVLERLDDPTS